MFYLGRFELNPCKKLHGSLESVIAITHRLSSLNFGPKRSKEQAKIEKKFILKKREREKKRKAKKKSHEKLYY